MIVGDNYDNDNEQEVSSRRSLRVGTWQLACDNLFLSHSHSHLCGVQVTHLLSVKRHLPNKAADLVPVQAKYTIGHFC